MTPNQMKARKSDLTRQAIIDTTEDFLRDHPFSDLSIAALMSLVGCSRPVFYQYFRDINELMLELLEDFTREVLELAETTPWLNAPEDPPAAMALMQKEVHQIAYRRAVVFRASQEAAAHSEELRQVWKRVMSEYDKRVAGAIQRDQAAGLVGDIDASLVATSLNQMNVGNMIVHFGSTPRTRVKRLLPSVVHIWVSSLYGEEAARRLA